MLHSTCLQIWKTQQWPQDWKRSVFIPIPNKDNVRKCSNYHIISFISHAIKVILKILQARLYKYLNWELQNVQSGFQRGRETRHQLPTFFGLWRKQGNFRKKKIYMSSSLFMLKYLTLWITTNCEKFLKKCEYDTNLPVSWETYMQVKKQQLELNMEWWTGFKLQKKYDKTVYSHPAYLASIHSTSWKITGWWITNWNQVCREKY